MPASIHPTALIHPDAEVHARVEIGAYAVIGPGVTLGEGCRIASHVVIEKDTELGPECRVSSHVVLGGDAQDLKYRGEPASLRLGAGCVIREFVTINRGTQAGGGETVLGDECYLMAYAHVAHDCHLGNGVILANNATLAGHVEVEDRANLGGLCAIHQFCRIGRLAFIGGGAMVRRDVPPFCQAKGDRARLTGLNRIGLERAGLQGNDQERIERVYRTLWHEGPEKGFQTLVNPGEKDTFLEEIQAFYQRSRMGISPAMDL